MESWSWRWSRSCAGDRPILWIGVFQHCKMVWATLSLSKESWGPVFLFTMSSARPLDWGYVMEDSLCLTHHVLRNSWNVLEVKGGPPSVLSSSEAWYLWNSCQQMDFNLVVVAWHGFKQYKMSQPVSLSMQARYVWSPIWKRSVTNCWNGQSGNCVKMIGSRSWLGAMFEHTMQFALILWIEASIRGQYTDSLGHAFVVTTPWNVGSAGLFFIVFWGWQSFDPIIPGHCQCWGGASPPNTHGSQAQ